MGQNAWGSMDFVALDFETTDLNDPLPIEIALVKVVNRKVQEEFVSLIRQDWISVQASQMHGLVVKDLLDQPTAEELAIPIKSFVNGMPILAHNASFDAKTAKNAGLHVPLAGSSIYCSLHLAKETLESADYKLMTLAQVLQISIPSHRALADAKAAAELVLAIMRRERIDSLHDLYILKGLRPGKFKETGYSEPSRGKAGGFQVTTSIRNSINKRIAEDRFPHPDWEGQEILITGVFLEVTRQEVTEMAIKMGAIPKDSLNKGTRFVITGLNPGKAKMEKLAAFRERGFQIITLTETEFLGHVSMAKRHNHVDD